jgi:hypothetical protein
MNWRRKINYHGLLVSELQYFFWAGEARTLAIESDPPSPSPLAKHFSCAVLPLQRLLYYKHTPWS